MVQVGPQFQQEQLAGIGGEKARPIARVENPPKGRRTPTHTEGRRGEQFKTRHEMNTEDAPER
jgi:hypothetical protein